MFARIMQPVHDVYFEGFKSHFDGTLGLSDSAKHAIEILVHLISQRTLIQNQDWIREFLIQLAHQRANGAKTSLDKTCTLSNDERGQLYTELVGFIKPSNDDSLTLKQCFDKITKGDDFFVIDKIKHGDHYHFKYKQVFDHANGILQWLPLLHIT